MDMKVSELRGRRQRQPSQKPSTSILWTRILALLEMLQIKKEIANVHLLIAPLFELLKNCLDEEEQAPLEYSKQLILSCLLSCCQQLPPGNLIETHVKSMKFCQHYRILEKFQVIALN